MAQILRSVIIFTATSIAGVADFFLFLTGAGEWGGKGKLLPAEEGG